MSDPLPLAAKRVVVTRAAAQGAALMEKLRAAGAIPFAAPAIEILPADDPTPLRDALAELSNFDWLICTSANAVRALLAAREEFGVTLPTTLRIAAVGNATARALAEAALPAQFQPSSAVAEALARELPVETGTRVLWPHGNLAAPDLANALASRGAVVTAVVAYRTVADVGLLGIVDALRDRRVDAITFTSASTVRHVVEGLAAAGVRLDRLPAESRPLIICIGPVSAAAARECGVTVDGIADPSDDDGLVAALIRTVTSRTAAA
jgi:uroporphyrinogen-III synthase